MKKIFLLFAFIAFVFGTNAQVLLNETFDYSTSKLAGEPGDPPANADNTKVGVWYKSGKTGDSSSESLVLEPEALYYEGYINSEVGKSVIIDNGGDGSNTRIDVVRFIDHANKFRGGGFSLYYAFMMNVEDIHSFSGGEDGKADWRDIVVVAEGGNDVLGNSLRGRFYLRHDPEDPYTIYYTISKNTNFTASVDPESFGIISPGETNLFIIKQTFTDDTNCQIEVTHNPEIGPNEPTEWVNGNSTDANTFAGTYGFGLRRRNLSSTAKISIGGLRIAKSFADVVGFTSGVKNLYDNHNIYVSGKDIVTNHAGNLKIYTLAGNEVVSTYTEGRFATDLNTGLYIVSFTDLNGLVSSVKIQVK